MDYSKYENVTKPKPIPVLSPQQVFDSICRKTLAQQIPCLSYREIIKPEDALEESDGSPLLTASMNSQGQVAPIYMMLSPEDMRVLRREFTWDELQFASCWEVRRYYVSSPVRREDSELRLGKRLYEMYTAKGITYDSVYLMEALETQFDSWGNYRILNDLFFEGRSEDQRIAIKNLLADEVRYKYKNIGVKYALSVKVLGF